MLSEWLLSEFFQTDPLLPNQIHGSYNLYLVLLSYLVAVVASYIALDITGRLRDTDNTPLSSSLWLVGGAVAMGAGIWSMHFIGMLAFRLDTPMYYDPFWTGASMVVAILASGFAFFLLKSKTMTLLQLGLGGIILGFAIASMHYVGMAGMASNMSIHYWPGLFFLSILIAIIASEAALWLAIKSNQGTLRQRINLKLISAIIMGLAICGMHYTGMAAAVFSPIQCVISTITIRPDIMAITIAIVTFFILGIAFAVSTHKEIMNYHVMKLAHQEGMAQVSANVLHNVGNVLNSVNVIATLVADRVSNSELSGLTDVSTILDKHQHDLGSFITTDPRGSKLPVYIKMLADYWSKEQKNISQTMHQLIDHIQYIKEVITLQQSHSVIICNEQIVAIEELLDESLIIAGLDNNQSSIRIEKQYGKIQPFIADKIKLLQILINLMRNGKYALSESSIKDKVLILRTYISTDEKIVIEVIDNGLGIAPENFSHIFRHGFTTKKDGHGFGLHASAITAKEMGGVIKVESDGVGKGATFTLEIPYNMPKK